MLTLIVAVVVVTFSIERILEGLNASRWRPSLPAHLKAFYSPEEYDRAREYFMTRQRLGSLQRAANLVVLLALLLTGGFGALSSTIPIDDDVMRALAFFITLGAGSMLLNLPFSYYSTFVVEERFGFNRMTRQTFFTDKVKALLLGLVLGGALGWTILSLVISVGEEFWLPAWTILAAVLLLVQMFYTSTILPLFNKLTPLAAGGLRERVERYAARVSFPLSGIYIMDGSKRSSKANAFFSGIGRSKKIVLFDSLVEKHTEDELESVLAHEVGHYKLKHIVIGTIASIAQLGLLLYVASRLAFNANLSKALGAEGWQLHLSLLAFFILYEPISLVIDLAMNALSRKHEFEADRFAVATSSGEAMTEALTKLHADNLAHLDPHPAYVAVHYSHPPLVERLRAIKLLTTSEAVNA